MEIFDVPFLKKRDGETEGMCRVEPTNQDVREVCLVLQIRLSKTSIESFRSISERKIKCKALELAFLKTSHHIHTSNRSIKNENFAFFQKPLQSTELAQKSFFVSDQVKTN